MKQEEKNYVENEIKYIKNLKDLISKKIEELENLNIKYESKVKMQNLKKISQEENLKILREEIKVILK